MKVEIFADILRRAPAATERVIVEIVVCLL